MSEYRQIDIFGNSIALSEMSEEKDLKHGGRITKKSLFRSIHGYKKDFIVRIVNILKNINITENILNVES